MERTSPSHIKSKLYTVVVETNKFPTSSPPAGLRQHLVTQEAPEQVRQWQDAIGQVGPWCIFGFLSAVGGNGNMAGNGRKYGHIGSSNQQTKYQNARMFIWAYPCVYSAVFCQVIFMVFPKACFGQILTWPSVRIQYAFLEVLALCRTQVQWKTCSSCEEIIQHIAAELLVAAAAQSWLRLSCPGEQTLRS